MFAQLPLLKLGAQLVAGMGVSRILGDIIKNNVIVTTPVQALTVKAGSLVLGSMLVEQSSNHIETMTTQVLEAIESRKSTPPAA